MLIELQVQNFAIVHDTSIQLDSGMTCFTGETGAGKSLLLSAISLLLGSKSAKELVRSGQEKAVVEGVFDLSADPRRRLWLEDQGFLVDSTDNLIVRREISASHSRSRIWIQGQAATRAQLQDLLGDWIEVSGQHEFLNLNKEGYLLKVIDRHGQLRDQLEAFQKSFSQMQDWQKKRELLLSRSQDKESMADLRRFQIEEFKKAGVHKDLEQEEEELRRASQDLQNSEQYKSACFESLALINDDMGTNRAAAPSLIESIDKIDALLEPFEDKEDKINKGLENLRSAKSLLLDAASFLQESSESFELDPDELEKAQERLSLIRRLQRKFSCDSTELWNLYQQFQAELRELEDFEGQLQEIETMIDKFEGESWSLARRLHKSRSKVAKELNAQWIEAVRALGMKRAVLELECSQSESLSNVGATRVQAMFSANPGTRPQAISKVASGGELSRILLALKSIVTTESEVCAYLFDEIDTGIGGETAQTVGEKLKKISGSCQVIVVTHLAQVAALAENHFCISKKHEKSKTLTKISRLKKTDRLSEIARMLGSSKSKAAASLAKEMLAIHG